MASKGRAVYLIYRAGEVVGRVEDTPSGPQVCEGDAELRAAVAAVLAAPAAEMTGGQVGDIMYDGVQVYDPGSPGHTRAALTGGALVQYGYIGMLAPTE